MKILVCDMCGTLVDYKNSSNSWSELFHIMGIDNNELYNLWDNNPDYSYLKFTHDTIRLLISEDISLRHIKELKENSIPKESIRKLVDFCDEREMEKIIITGGIGNVGELIINEYGFDHCYSSCYFRFTNNGDLSGYNVQKCGSSEQKLKILKEHIRNEEIEFDDIIFVGDDHNDNHLAEEINKSFDVGDYGINSTHDVDSLDEIIEYL